MKQQNLREIVQIVIQNHPRDCVFKPNAVQNILDAADEAAVSLSDSNTLIDFLEAAIREQEIYCPHEGIDKRAEFYRNKNVAGWNAWSQIAHEMV